jgi:hypothetical protein
MAATETTNRVAKRKETALNCMISVGGGVGVRDRDGGYSHTTLERIEGFIYVLY